MSSGFGFIGCVLTHSCVSPDTHVHCNDVHVPAHVQHARMASWSVVGHLTASTDKLLDCIAFVVVFLLLRMRGTSPLPLDVSDKSPRPSVSTMLHLTSPASKSTPVPLPSPPVVSLLLSLCQATRLIRIVVQHIFSTLALPILFVYDLVLPLHTILQTGDFHLLDASYTYVRSRFVDPALTNSQVQCL